ncbi:Uncharacterized protein SCF082_LOCUS27290 [Durusdinium trenchii]|uniref:Uncharacterized protein n=1 Tax=Durusdinium trenchii TaxID=1381693 RepID=A0ABP0MCI5_9DINO
MCKTWGMAKFLTHESIANQFFMPGVSVAAASHSAWQDVLVLSEDSLQLMTKRMSHNYSTLNVKMRKPWSSKELEPLARSCITWQLVEKAFREKYPKAFCDAEMPNMLKSFMYRHCDAELLALLDSTVPPVQLEKIGPFQYAINKFQKQAPQFIGQSLPY